MKDLEYIEEKHILVHSQNYTVLDRSLILVMKHISSDPHISGSSGFNFAPTVTCYSWSKV